MIVMKQEKPRLNVERYSSRFDVPDVLRAAPILRIRSGHTLQRVVRGACPGSTDPVGHTRLDQRCANKNEHGAGDEGREELPDDTWGDKGKTDRPDASEH